MNIIEVTIRSIDATKAGISSAEGGFGGLGKAASGAMAVAAAAIAGVGLAVAALGAQLFKAMDIEAARSKLQAQLGLTAAESETYGRLAGELYSSAYGESLDDVNEALRFVTQNIGDQMGESEGALKDASAAALDLANAFDVDLSESTRAAGILLKNGLAANAEEAFDIITVGMQNGVNAGDDLTDTISEYAPLFSRLGLSGQQALGMISQSMKAGARDSDFAADAIKEFSIRAIDGSKLTIEAFKDLGLNAEEMQSAIARGGPGAAQAMDTVLERLRGIENPSLRAATAVKLFGTKAEDLGDSLLAIDPSTAVASLGEVAGAADRMGDSLANNAKTKLETFKRTIETNVSNFIGETVLPKVVELAEKAAPALETFKNKAIEAFQWIAGKPEALAAVAAAVGVVLVVAFGALAVAAWSAAAGVIAATWPILLIGAAIAGLAAILVYAYNNWDTFRNVVDTVVSFVRDNAAPAFELIKSAVISFYEVALAPLIGYIQQNSEAFANIGKVLLVIAAVIVGVLVVAFVAGIAVMIALAAVGSIVIVALVAVIAVIYNVIQVLWDWIGTARDVAGGIIDNIENIIQVFWDMANNVGTAVANVVRAIWMVIQVGWDLAQNIGSAIADAARWVWSLAMKANDMANEIGGAVGRAVAWFFGLPGRILGAVGNLGSVLLNAGRDVVAGLIRGITDKIGELKSKLGELTRLIPFSKGPPAKDRRLLRPSGQWIMGGLMDGIASRVPDLRKQLNGITDVLPSTIDARGRAATVNQLAAVAGPGMVVNNYVQGSIRSDRDLVRLVRDSQNDRGLAPAGG